jgi:hypothetical protein
MVLWLETAVITLMAAAQGPGSPARDGGLRHHVRRLEDVQGEQQQRWC